MITQNQKFRVYVKSTWSAGWTWRGDIEPLSCSRLLPPGMGKATFRLRYGDGFWEDLSSMADGSAV